MTIRLRNSRGSVLADSAVGMWLVIGGVIFGALVLLNVGSLIYFKIKLGYIVNATATYASSMPPGGTRNAAITTFANNTMTAMGFNPANFTIGISDTTIVTRPAVKINFTTHLTTLVSNALLTTFIPQQIMLSETSVAAQKYWYWGDGELINPFGGTCTFPLVNSTGALPNDGLPAYKIGLFTSLQRVR